ncbi:TPA: hypothetical protein ACNEXA_002595 [Escherichia coli]
MTSFIKVPFASSGDKAAVPDTDAGGGVNMTQGYGQAYSLDPATDPSAKRIERDKMNWLFNRITQAINEIQSGGVAPFITSADNGGSAFSYGKGALVSLSGVVYQSLVASNTSTPPGANWSALPEKIQPLDATLTALAGLVGAANKLPYFNGDDTAALADLTQVGRDIIGKTDIAAVLQYLGLVSTDGSVGRLVKCQVFNTSGTYTPTAGTKFAIVEVVGGGAGGGCQVGTGSNAACGGGGMSGEYVKARVDTPVITTVTIGSGGVGVSAAAGPGGGDSSFGAGIKAKGGLGGAMLSEGASVAVVGPTAGYAATGFTGANIFGSGSGYTMPGTRYSGILAIGGPGGSSALGAGGGSQAIVGEGFDAKGPGGGGSGACVYGGATQQRAGGAGMKGIVLVWEYA